MFFDIKIIKFMNTGIEKMVINFNVLSVPL